MFTGFSKQAWGPIKLPFNLTVFGMNGCSLYASPEFLAPIPPNNGVARFTLALPNDPAFAGAGWHNQGFVLDKGANALGATVSNAGTVTLGLR